jgi:hypothetical protein
MIPQNHPLDSLKTPYFYTETVPVRTPNSQYCASDLANR